MVNIKIDAELKIPLHQQIENGIRELISEKRCQPGDFLFTEVALSRECGISRDSVRQGINRLVNNGLLERRRAKGVFLLAKEEGTARGERIVSFVTPDVRHSFYGSLVGGGLSGTRECGYQMMVFNSNYDGGNEAEILRKLLEMPPHPVVICSNGTPECLELIARLSRQGFQLVSAGCYFPGISCDTVTNDNIAIGRDAVNFLIGLGHRKIAHATVSNPFDVNASMRLAGYTQAMKAAGLQPEHFITLAANESWQIDSERRTTEWLRSRKGDPPTAIFAVNDTVCIGIMRALIRLGYSVPGDISLLGCANLDLAQAFLDPLSTIDQFSYEMGHRAVFLGIRRHEGALDLEPIHELHPHKLIERMTTRRLEESPIVHPVPAAAEQ